MGIVLKQSINNTLITYIGFGIGAINHLFLFTRFMSDSNFGLVTVITSAATVLMPILAFGVPNTLVKYFSNFKDSEHQNGFLTLMLLLPLACIIPLWLLSYFAYDTIAGFLSVKNDMLRGYVWHIFLIALAMAYFEVFYAWAKVHMKSVFGNFMKEIFVRFGTTVLLVLIYLNVISVDLFLNALVGLYIVRMVVMKFSAYRLHMPKLDFNFPENTKTILSYSSFIILGASAAIVLLEIDKVMLNQFLEIKNVAYYGVATYIAMVIIVPSRSMHQITYPLTATLMNNGDLGGLKRLYRKSSLTLFIASALLFLLIVCNVNALYLLLPEAFRGGFTVVFIVGLIKVYDSLLGNVNSILYNSRYYRATLLMGVFLALLTVLFNLWLIPKFGIDGAAIASFLAFFVYNTIKLIFVKVKFKMQPFTTDTFKVFMLSLSVGLVFYFLNFNLHPIIDILVKGSLITICYVGVLYRFRISEDVFKVLSRFLTKKR